MEKHRQKTEYCGLENVIKALEGLKKAAKMIDEKKGKMKRGGDERT
ncbi:MAG: hypothetical protein GY857_19085 [Desulfobacula sp.]|nr:hypothetical protein [Desulfobacula sp.]